MPSFFVYKHLQKRKRTKKRKVLSNTLIFLYINPFIYYYK